MSTVGWLVLAVVLWLVVSTAVSLAVGLIFRGARADPHNPRARRR